MIRFSRALFEWSDQLESRRAVALLAEPGLSVTIELPGQSDPAKLMHIPAGSASDGASRPWLTAFLLEPWGRAGLAPVLHDELLRHTDIPKWEADLLFLYALRSVGVPAFLATILYFAVRMRRPGKPVTT